MITEDYVTFETAKLLKEKGLEIPLTIQMAMKWLREAHNIHPSIVVDDFDGKAFYRIEGIFVSGSEHRWVSYYPSDDDKTEGLYSTYEQASEAAIKYCLENLI